MTIRIPECQPLIYFSQLLNIIKCPDSLFGISYLLSLMSQKINLHSCTDNIKALKMSPPLLTSIHLPLPISNAKLTDLRMHFSQLLVLK